MTEILVREAVGGRRTWRPACGRASGLARAQGGRRGDPALAAQGRFHRLRRRGRPSRAAAEAALDRVAGAVEELAPLLPHDAAYHRALVTDLRKWADAGFGVPDFLDSLLAFHPAAQRADGLQHLVVFPMYTQNGNPDRNLEAVVLRMVWPEWLADLERTRYDNPLFCGITFEDFTAGYDTNSAVLFPETVAVREAPERFTWGGIFCDREAARFRRVIEAAVDVLRLELPDDIAADGRRPGALPAGVRAVGHGPRPHPQPRGPAVRPLHDQAAPAVLDVRPGGTALRPHRLPGGREAGGRRLPAGPRRPVRRTLRPDVPLPGHRRAGPQLRRPRRPAALRLPAPARRACTGRTTRCSIDWELATQVTNQLCAEIETLYRDGIDRPKLVHWFAAYDLVSTLPRPAPGLALGQGSGSPGPEPAAAQARR